VEVERARRWGEALGREDLVSLVHSKEELRRWGYIVQIPRVRKPFDVEALAKCDRCRSSFTMRTRSQGSCVSHVGKLVRMTSKDGSFWSCCQNPTGSIGCTSHETHVRKLSNAGELHSLCPFEELPSELIEGEHHSVVSLDCEMGYTTHGMELLRCTLLDASNAVLIDTMVLPSGDILDYNTRYSGITPTTFLSAITFPELRELLRFYLSRQTIILGHGLENDLITLRLIHSSVVDTAILFPHPHGRPYRLGLKELVKRELGVEVQTAGEEGHSSVEDAAAAAMLIRKRARMGDFPGSGKVRIGGEME
jgi:RNA exonuclease